MKLFYFGSIFECMLVQVAVALKVKRLPKIKISFNSIKY